MVSNIQLRRNALILVWIGEIWNIGEAAIALWSGIASSSVALMAFGLDSIIELFAGGVLIWRLTREKSQAQEAEERAVKLVGFSFFLLAGYIALHSVATLFHLLPEPEPSVIGIMLVIASAVVMTALFFQKRAIAKQINSPALAAEAKQSLFCDLQDLPVLLGLGLNAAFNWWWADPVVALILIPLIIREGRESFSNGDNCCH
jgi:divalent metal cation (Fe/Co/Zn/Cd) transporter